MKEIGIKLADGSFYPIMEDGSPCNKDLVLTTVKDNQTRVLVDLYRSKTGTMEDAEYIDSLQIENLVEHPNGSVELSLNIGLDENNKLSASMNDPETGASSDASVTLVSRTMEERLEPTNYEVVGDNQEEGLTKDDDSFELPDENLDVVLDSDSDFELPDEINDSEIIVENPAVTDDKTESNESENSEISEPEDSSKNVAGAAVAGVAAGGLLAKVMANQKSEEKVEDEFSLPSDVNLGAEKAAADMEFDSQNKEETDFNNDLELPDFMDDDEPPKESLSDFEMGSDTNTDVNTDADAVLDKTEDKTVEVSQNTENENSDKTIADESFEEPVFENLDNKNDTTEDMFSSEDLELPDFSDETENSNEVKSSEELNDEDFLNTINASDDNDADKYVKDATPSSGIIFDGLYDKETAAGNSSTENEESVEKKTKTPVVICVVCAIICIIATLLILFVVPSKYNLLNKNNKSSNEIVEVEPSDEQLPEISEESVEPIESKEDEIVVATEPEVVENIVPIPPKEPEVKPENISYKIKWGDTLWDISDAYYKNPWKYHMVAKYNGIKNPDYIISGTTIVLPAK